MTGLPEYRNGGLLVDTGLLTLKEKDRQRGLANAVTTYLGEKLPANEIVPVFEPSDDVIVEWRALTVGYLDELLSEVNRALGLEGSSGLSLAQMLEAGTWKVRLPFFKSLSGSMPWPSSAEAYQGGREIAAELRPITKGPPIAILSDGTIF